MQIRPLDLVRTPQGGLALVTEFSPATDSLKFNRYSVIYVENPGKEYNAWWFEDELTFLCSIPVLIAEGMCHPFGNNIDHVKEAFGYEV